MLTLYVKTGCPFCYRVLTVADELDLTVTQKNIAETAVTAELVSRGGKRQVPYFVDDSNGTEMYESEDIVAYLREHYAKIT